MQAALRDGRIKVMVPDGLDAAEEREFVEQMATRIKRRATSAEVDLVERARQLARRYDLPMPREIVWSDRQMVRWGSCSPETGRIRVSDRLAAMPPWVLDSVLVHEMAHLEVAGHGPQFQALVDRYELAERAKGYLIAKSEDTAGPQT